MERTSRSPRRTERIPLGTVPVDGASAAVVGVIDDVCTQKARAGVRCQRRGFRGPRNSNRVRNLESPVPALGASVAVIGDIQSNDGPVPLRAGTVADHATLQRSVAPTNPPTSGRAALRSTAGRPLSIDGEGTGE